MDDGLPSLVSNLRAASRELVRELGFMNRAIAGTDLSPSAVHAIVEISVDMPMSSKALSEKLLLDKSTISRLVKSLMKKNLVQEEQANDDGRSKKLSLTSDGEKMLQTINQYAEQRVSAAVILLPEYQQDRILDGVQDFSKALKRSRVSADQKVDSTHSGNEK